MDMEHGILQSASGGTSSLTPEEILEFIIKNRDGCYVRRVSFHVLNNL